jgi:ribosomal protein L32
LARKGVTVWLFSSLTVFSLIHLIEATSVLLFNYPVRLLQLYPLIGEKLQTIPPAIYFWATAAATMILWGITCVIVFENPVEAFLNKILSDAKKQGSVESQLLEQKSEVLDMMSETIETNGELLAQVADTVHNVRAEVKDIQPIKDTVDKIKTELNGLRREVKKLEGKEKLNICPVCGKPLLPEFKICPYCGEQQRLKQTPMITVKDYK